MLRAKLEPNPIVREDFFFLLIGIDDTTVDTDFCFLVRPLYAARLPE